MKKKQILSTITVLIININISFSQIPSYIDTSGLIAWWSFSGNANDNTGNGNNGTVYGATLTSDRYGQNNKAYYFSGSGCSTRIEANTNTASIATTGQMSLSIWVLRVSNGCIGPRYFEAWPGSNSPGHFVLSWDNNSNYPQGITHRIVGNNNTVSSTNNFDTVPNNNWTNIIYTIDGVTAKVWQDGNLKSIDSIAVGSLVSLASNIAIGRMNHPAWDAINGKVDDIGIWNRALTQLEITNIYNGCLTTYSANIQFACDSYTWIQNGVTFTTSGTYKDTVTNAAGCDSIISLNLTINSSSVNLLPDTITVCDSIALLDATDTAAREFNKIIGLDFFIKKQLLLID